MVKRCGFYVDGPFVRMKTVQIVWDLGFDRKAKTEYVRRVKDELKKSFPVSHIEDVTSASEYWGRQLSPLLMKDSNGISIEDAWHNCTNADTTGIEFNSFVWPRPNKDLAFLHFYCLHAEQVLPKIKQIDIFVDVFHNPDKGNTTQALACAIYKLLNLRREVDVLGSVIDFVTWYEYHVRIGE